MEMLASCARAAVADRLMSKLCLPVIAAPKNSVALPWSVTWAAVGEAPPGTNLCPAAIEASGV